MPPLGGTMSNDDLAAVLTSASVGPGATAERRSTGHWWRGPRRDGCAHPSIDE